MREKLKIALAGQYSEGTLARLQGILTGEQFRVFPVETEEAYQNMTDADVIVLRIFKAPAMVMEQNPNLKMIIRWGAGYDSVDIEEAGKRGILVTNTPGANAGAVAELTVLMMLALGRKILSHQACLHQGDWSKNTYLNESSTLFHKKIGIIGGGNIGRQVAKLTQAFGAETRYFDPYRMSHEMEASLQMEFLPLTELLQTSDIITLHIPLTEESRHIIGEKEIGMMKENAILINTARGGLVDEKALLEAVKHKRLAGAGIDCVEQEPLKPKDELLQNPNILVTPHIGGGTADLAEVILPMIADNILSLYHGDPVRHVVNERIIQEARRM